MILEIDRKRNSGFTLVEMIISVAFLAIISVIIVQLFISAKNLSLKAHDLDQSVFISKKIIAAFKSCEHPEDFAKISLLDKAADTVSDDVEVFTLYFDEDWNQLDPDKLSLDKHSLDERFPDKAVFTADVELKPLVAEEEGAYSENGLYRLHIKVQKTGPYLMEEEVGSELFSITSDKYFGS